MSGDGRVVDVGLSLSAQNVLFLRMLCEFIERGDERSFAHNASAILGETLCELQRLHAHAAVITETVFIQEYFERRGDLKSFYTYLVSKLPPEFQSTVKLLEGEIIGKLPKATP